MNFSPNQRTLDFAHLPPPTLSNYLAGPNMPALTCLRQLRDRTLNHQVVYLWGPASSGKTHLLLACANFAKIFDDIDQATEDTQREAFVTLTHVITNPQALVILSGRKSPSDLLSGSNPVVRPDLATRIAQALIFQLNLLSEAELRLALSLSIAERRLHADPELIDWLLVRFPRDLGSLRAALDSLDHFSLIQKKPLTLGLARQWLASLRDDPAQSG